MLHNHFLLKMGFGGLKTCKDIKGHLSTYNYTCRALQLVKVSQKNLLRLSQTFMTLAKTCTVLFKGSKRGVVGPWMIFNNFLRKPETTTRQQQQQNDP